LAADAAVVAIPAALAGALCAYQITARSLGFDEAASVTIVSQHGGALWSAIAHDGGNMSVYYLLLHVVIGVLGDGVLAVRIASAAATAGCVAALALLARRLFGRQVALAAGLLTAVSLPLVFWGQSARGYALMAACITASCLCFAVLVDRHVAGRNTRWAGIAYVVLTTAAVYAGFVAVLVIPAQLVSLAVYRRAVRPVALAVGASLALCTPLLFLAIGRGSGQLFWVPRPSFKNTGEVLQSLTSAGLRPTFALTSTSVLLLAITLALLVVAVVRLGRGLARAAGDRDAWARALVLAWLLFPFLFALLESAVGQSIYLPRNLLSSVPAVGLALGWLLFAGRPTLRLSRATSTSTLVSALALGILLALRALQLASSYAVSPEDWRGATAYVVQHTRPGDCIAFYPSDGRMAFAYYLGLQPRADDGAPRSVLPVGSWGEMPAYVEDYATLTAGTVSRLPTVCHRLWFVSSHQGQADGPSGSLRDLARYESLQSELSRRFPASSTVSFGYANVVRVELLTR
jgi:uncharacterized membrane protein